MYPVFSTSLFLLILGTTSFPGTLNFIGELFNMISLSIVDVVFNGLFVTSIPLTTSYSLFLFKRSCGNIYLNYRNQTMDVSRLYLWIPSAALFPLTDSIQWSITGLTAWDNQGWIPCNPIISIDGHNRTTTCNLRQVTIEYQLHLYHLYLVGAIRISTPRFIPIR